MFPVFLPAFYVQLLIISIKKRPPKRGPSGVYRLFCVAQTGLDEFDGLGKSGFLIGAFALDLKFGTELDAGGHDVHDGFTVDGLAVEDKGDGALELAHLFDEVVRRTHVEAFLVDDFDSLRYHVAFLLCIYDLKI